MKVGHVVGLLLGTVLAASATHADNSWRPTTNPLMTPWADKVDPAHPLAEYPRPQMVRKDWVNLNGLWFYVITAHEAEKPLTPPRQGFVISSTEAKGNILVPFCVEA